jgi:bile acid-coenzyme A ligase
MTSELTPLTQHLSELAAADPRRPAVILGERTIDRGELELAAERLARTFTQLGAGHGDYISIVLRNSAEFVAAAIAAWKIGATPQPLAPRLVAAELSQLIELCNPAVVVGTLAPSVIGARPQVAAADVFGEPLSGGEPMPAMISPSLKAMGSGGSSGRPKCIVSTAPAALQSVAYLAPTMGIEAGDVSLLTTPLAHNAPFVSMIATLVTGGHLVLADHFDPLTTLELVERHHVSWLYLVPTMMSRIWKLPTEKRDAPDLRSLRTVIHAGAPCPRWLKHAWIDWLGPERLLEMYSSTEGVVAFTATGTEWRERPGTAGKPLNGGLVQVRSGSGEVLPAGATGLIWVHRRPGIEPSYRYIGATATTDADGWDTLGDIGRLDDDGYLYVVDREADMIVLADGSNVYPAEVEAVINAFEGVEDSCVVGLPDDDFGQYPHAIVFATEAVTSAALLDHLSELVAPYKLRTVEFVDHALRDEAGKIRRSQLRSARLGSTSSGSTDPRP